MLDLILNVTLNIFLLKIRKFIPIKMFSEKGAKSCYALSFIWRFSDTSKQYKFWLTLTENFSNVSNFKNSSTFNTSPALLVTANSPATCNWSRSNRKKSSSHHTSAYMSELSSRDTGNPTKFFLIQFIPARTLANLNSRHEELPHAFFSSTHHSPLVVYDGIDLNNKSETE